ncbi:MAG TPA: isoprenylcysteine carboxylmethyltransferase family protein [Gemmatimonadales bacterium]|nr:isoprenylcysteine carboxylmethyltransferase family protein [Gemmatimonadales bacterium]
MIVLFRALTYGTLFVGLLLVFVPDRILTQAGIVRPPVIGPVQIAGMLVVVAGAALAIASVLTFAFVGKGTPAPFDPPRELVIAGPYRWVRNPMYIGAGLVLLGAAMFYGSFGLALYTIVFWSMAHLFVLFYEEPILRKKFGPEYEAYSASRRRWMPRWRS